MLASSHRLEVELSNFKATHTVSKKIEIRPGAKEEALESILLVKPRNSICKHTIQDSDFVTLSSAFHHVFLLTVKKRCR